MPKTPFDALVSKEVLAAATRSAAEKGRSVGWILNREHGIPMEALGQALEKHHKLPFVPWSEGMMPIEDLDDPVLLDHLHFSTVVQIGRDGTKPVFLMADPDNLPLRDELAAVFGRNHAVRVGLREHILCLLRGITPDELAATKPPPPLRLLPDLDAEPEETSVVLAEDDAPGIVSVVNGLLLAFRKEKSDELRIDPREEACVARRKGDRWEDCLLPAPFVPNLIGRLKVMAGLDPGNRNKRQKGTFQLATAPGVRIAFEVAVEPLGEGREAARVTPAEV